MRAHTLICFTAALLAADNAQAIEFFWPLASPTCSTTLQDCINQTVPGRGDMVTIVDDLNDVGGADGFTFISENILINRDVTLRGAPDVEAIFTGTNSILMDLAPGQTGAVRELSLTSGRVRMNHIGPDRGFATYIVERLRFRAFTGVAGPGALDCAIYANSIEQSPSGPTGTFGRFIIRMNQIELVQSSQGTTGICLNGNRFAGSAAKSEISMNRIRFTSTAAAQKTGVYLSFDNGAIEVRRNQIQGASVAVLDQDYTPFLSGGTLHDTLISHNVAEGFGTAISATTRSGSVKIAHNTLVCPVRGIGAGINTNNLSNSPGVTIQIINNLITRCGTGVNASTVNSSNSNNLVFDSSTPFAGALGGPGTLFADPRFESATYYRPLPNSPAVNSGFVDAAVAGFDVEGNRQPSLAPDIGAYEQVKDIGMRESFSGGAIAEPLALSNPFLLSNDHPIATPLRGAGYTVAQLEQAQSLWFDGTSWLLRVGIQPLAAGREFNIMAPRENHAHFLQTAAIRFPLTELNHPSTNDQQDAVVIANERFDRVGTNALDGNPFGLNYSTATNRWSIVNQNSAPISVGARFDVIVSTLDSAMSFSTQILQAAPVIALRHPFLDDNPCAVFSVGRRGAVFNPAPFVVNYVPGSDGGQRPGRWRIEQPSNVSFPLGAEFNVIVDGTASSRCTTPTLPNAIFSNGFE